RSALAEFTWLRPTARIWTSRRRLARFGNVAVASRQALSPVTHVPQRILDFVAPHRGWIERGATARDCRSVVGVAAIHVQAFDDRTRAGRRVRRSPSRDSRIVAFVGFAGTIGNRR